LPDAPAIRVLIISLLATRVKWYEPPQGHSYRTYAMATEPIPSDEPLPEQV
jgi:hypothetical protein